MKNHMLGTIALFACMGITLGCKSGMPVAESPPFSEPEIVGSWEGCDGRVVTFSLERDGSILGRYTELGGLERYQFTPDEVGYRVQKKGPGIYEGQVKWQDISGNESWKKVRIEMDGEETLLSDGSDGCSREMIRKTY